MDKASFVFAHLADAHVGAWARDPAIRLALRQSLLRSIAVAEERGAEFLLISGDLFHTPVPDPTEVAPVAAALRAFTERGRRVYVIYGSHDYVAHRTSWLDVLAETGIFLRAAPEAVRAEGTRWTLPFQIDEPTGAVIAGISGRSHGLDRSYFAAVDSESFRQQPGFRIFQFHAAVDEFLPEGLREHIHGIHRDDLPRGCDYYAGGHIHYTYVGSGPEGGLLVNPGAVFGTSLTDLENGIRGRTHQGLAIVTVENGVPSVEFVDTAPRERLRVFDVDISGKSADEARSSVQKAIEGEAGPGLILLPRLHGTLSSGTLGGLGLGRTERGPGSSDVEAIHWDLRDTAPTAATAESSTETEYALVDQAISTLAAADPGALGDLWAGRAEAGIRELLKELSQPISEGEGRQDYETARIDGAFRILGVRPEPRG
ncbi:MAG TPA: DNA repair exonuclease [Thermoplasmata archaeon]|nr:DNA repair exonuclease [Thermoplasmata archaeon]